MTDNYLWTIDTVNSTTWTISGGGDTVEIPKASWIHITTEVTQSDKTAKITITDGDTELYSGTVTCVGETAVKGVFILGGRYNSVTSLDNITVKSKKNYTVVFDKNGGEGTMPNQGFEYGAEQALSENIFTKQGYSFKGWATTANGAVVYADKEKVKNLVKEIDGTITLYAVWETLATPTPVPTTVPTEKPTKVPEETVAPTSVPKAEMKKGETVKVGDIQYTVNSTKKKTVIFKKPAKKTKKKIIPTKVTVKKNGKKTTYKVVGIAKKAFYNNKKITKITITKNIRTIGNAAFRNCKKLKKIIVKSTSITKIGKNGLKGIAKDCIIIVPKGKKKAYTKMFRKAGLSSKVKIVVK